MLDIKTAATFADLPGAFFFGEPVPAEHKHAAVQYERVIASYEADGDEAAL
jgi:hypothetical protein